jgi:RimJ/RimL family protein N-acetyltransferase
MPEVDGPRLDTWFADDPDGAWQVFLERPSPDQRAVLEAAINGPEHHNWIIEVGEPVGLVRLSTRNRPIGKAALLYYVPRVHRKRGYATRAVARVVRYAFEDLGFSTVVADLLLTNEASAAVLKKVGFAPTGQRTLARTERGPEQVVEWGRERNRTEHP